jgi:sulfate permease, SulP family
VYRVKENLTGDFFGGVNVAIVSLPLAMAFGVESGLGATAGLIGCIVLGLVASWFGGTPLLISGPTGPMTVVSSLVIANELERSSDIGTALTTLFIIFLLAGLFQIFLGLIRIGQYIHFVPYSLVSGFMSGIGLMMVVFQLLPLLGHASTLHFQEILISFGELSSFNVYALGLGLATLSIIYLFPRFTKAVPSTLIALIIITSVSYFLKLKVPTIGDVPDEWMRWRWSHLIAFDQTQWSDVLLPAITLSLLGSVDTLLTCLVTDTVTGNNHNSDKELIAQGTGNIMSAIAGGLPGAGATVRTMLNIRSGAKTKMSVVIQSALLALVFFEVADFIHFIPLSVLAAILISVGISIIDYKSLLTIFKISPSDGWVMVVVMLTTLVFGLLPAFAAGVILASLLFVKKMADENTGKTKQLHLIPQIDREGIEPVYFSREVYVQELQGPLFFGFAFHFKQALKELPHSRAIIFRMERVPFIDHSGIFALQEVIGHLKAKGMILIFTGLHPSVEDQLSKSDIVPQLVHPEMIFNSFAHAADWLEKFLKENPERKLSKSNLYKDLDLKFLKNRSN